MVGLTLAAVLLAPRAEARNYYVAANGSDTGNNGQAPGTAWQTLSKVNASMSLFRPGDSILFRRGDIFRGSLTVTCEGSAAAPIVFGAYRRGSATGEPILSGATPITGWQVWRNGIWWAPVATPVTQLFSNQPRANQPTPARHPNPNSPDAGAGAGYFTIDNVVTQVLSPTSKLFHPQSNALTERDDAWTGARFHARFENWEWFVGNVTDFAAATNQLNLSSRSYYKDGFRTGWGFYLTNKLRALDATHEWYCSAGNDSLYYKPAAGVNPNALGLEGSVNNVVVRINKTVEYVTLVNLNVVRAAHTGVNVSGDGSGGAQHLSFRNVDVVQSAEVGMQLGRKVRRTLLKDCRILDSGKNALFCTQNEYVTLDHCQVRRTGLVPGLYDRIGPAVTLTPAIVTESDPTTGESVRVTYPGFGHKITYCVVDSSGKHGIDLRDGGSLVEKTVVSYASLVASDVGAIYIIKEAAVHDTVRHCFFSHTQSYLAAQPAADRDRLGVGMYVDDFAEHLVLEHNTCYANDAMGIHLINGRACEVRNNVTYGNTDIEMSFAEQNQRDPPVPRGWSSAHVVENNVFYALSASASVVRMSTQYDGINFGITNNNLCINPYTDLLFKLGWRPSSGSIGTKVSLEGWRHFSEEQTARLNAQGLQPTGEQDRNSRESSRQLTGYTNVVYGATLLDNNFNTNSQGWGNSSATDFSLTRGTASPSPIEGGVMRATFIGPAINSMDKTYLTAGTRFPLTDGQLYEVKISLRGASSRRIDGVKTQILTNASQSVGFNPELLVLRNRRDYVRIFEATRTDAQAKFNFELPSEPTDFYFDNVRVRAIMSATRENPRLRSQLLTNPADEARVVPLTGTYFNPDGSPITGNSVTVAPWSSRIVVSDDGLPDPLPVELTEFMAKPAIGGGADLSWTTASERNSAWFVVERAVDAAGTAFHPIGRVAAQGTSTQAVSYRFRDAAPCPAGAGGTRYYRLRQLDTDSTAHFSPVRPLACAPTGNAVAPLVASPNPATSAFALPGAPAGTLTVTDLCGRVVRTLVLPASAAPVVDLGPVPAGTYLLRLRTAEGALRTGKVQYE